jgi:NADPH:quinone reductase-like Zn-dependent oxidoreductase
MKSIIQNAYGNEKTLERVDLPKPKVIHPKDVLIQVHVANISSGEAFQEAHRHVYEGHKTGNVLLMIHQPTLTKK